MQNAKLQSYLHFHFIVFIWGFTAVLGALISIDAIPLVFYRMWLASGFIVLWLLFKKKSLNITKQQLLIYTIAGIIIALHWLTFFGAIKVSNVSITLAVMSTGAFFTSLLEPLFYKRKIIAYEVFFGVLVVIGLYIIFKVETKYQLGLLLAVISAFLSAVFSIINGKLAQKGDAAVISFYELLTGVIAISIYLGFETYYGIFSNGYSTAFFQLSFLDWLYIGILASLCTAYAFIASVAVMKYLSPYTVMLTINLEPVYGIFLAFLVFGNTEQMTPEFYYGALLILSTVILNGLLKNKSNITKLFSERKKIKN